MSQTYKSQFDLVREPFPPQPHIDESPLDHSASLIPPKVRSDIAAVAGFSGLALVFSRFSLAPLLWAHFPRNVDMSRPDEAALVTLFFICIPLPGLIAPLVLWLGIKAWADLDLHSYKSGRGRATFALLIGLAGTLVLIGEIYQVARILMSPM